MTWDLMVKKQDHNFIIIIIIINMQFMTYHLYYYINIKYKEVIL